MKKLWSKIETVLMNVMATMWLISIVAISVGVFIWSIRWVLRLVGVL